MELFGRLSLQLVVISHIGRTNEAVSRKVEAHGALLYPCQVINQVDGQGADRLTLGDGMQPKTRETELHVH